VRPKDPLPYSELASLFTWAPGAPGQVSSGWEFARFLIESVGSTQTEQVAREMITIFDFSNKSLAWCRYEIHRELEKEDNSNKKKKTLLLSLLSSI
jgi:hypothetical protein